MPVGLVTSTSALIVPGRGMGRPPTQGFVLGGLGKRVKVVVDK
jgi:hypothetical protein